MAEGPLYPSTTVDDGGGSFSWNNVTGVNAVFATDSKVASASSDTAAWTATNYIKSTNFGFAIPSSATIEGIKVEILRDASNNIASPQQQVKDSNLHLLKAGSETGDEKADTSTIWVDGGGAVENYTLITYGGNVDLWGTTWTPSEINDSGFGMRFRPQIYDDGAGTTAADIDYFRITVYYTEGNIHSLYLRSLQ